MNEFLSTSLKFFSSCTYFFDISISYFFRSFFLPSSKIHHKHIIPEANNTNSWCQKLKNKLTVRGAVRGASLALCAVNVVGCGLAYTFGKREKEEEKKKG